MHFVKDTYVHSNPPSPCDLLDSEVPNSAPPLLGKSASSLK